MTPELSEPARKATPSLFTADRFAYAAVIAGALAQLLHAVLPRDSAYPSPSEWLWIAIPLVLLAFYTLLSGLALRRRPSRLGDFDAAARPTNS